MKHVKKIKLWQKIVLSICAFAVPLAALTFFLFRNYDHDIHFTQMELYGNEYQRPLEQLLKTVPQHQFLAARYLQGDKSLGGDLSLKAGDPVLDKRLHVVGQASRCLRDDFQTAGNGINGAQIVVEGRRVEPFRELSGQVDVIRDVT